MDTNYLVLCGMVWAQFGQESAGRELIRALASSDDIYSRAGANHAGAGRWGFKGVDRAGAGGG